MTSWREDIDSKRRCLGDTSPLTITIDDGRGRWYEDHEKPSTIGPVSYEDESVQKLLDRKFDDSFGGEEGYNFTAWSANYVYFPCCYDGSEWVGAIPRNPCSVAGRHRGG
jgi:hypothetical protein